MKYDFEGEMGGDEQIYGPVPESVEPNRYKPWRGTSFSCPVVSGIMACLMEKHPDTSVIPAPHAKKTIIKALVLSMQLEYITYYR